MRAIPQCYPVTVESAAGDQQEVVTEGVVAELYVAGQPIMMESGNVVTKLRVVARSEEMARERAERVTKGVVVEVGTPTPLQDYSKRKALPYRRSFVMSRFKRGRFCQQGGTGIYQGTVLPDVSTDTGSPIGEAVDSLMGPQLLSERDTFRLARHYLKMQYLKLGFEDAEEQADVDLSELLVQFRAKYPQLNDTQLAGLLTRKTRKDLENIARGESFREGSNSHFEHQNMSVPRTNQTADQSTSRESMATPSVESLVAGYPEAKKLYKKLSAAPVKWLESTRGRKVIVDAVYGIRLREGNVPADAIEAAYLSMPGGTQTSLAEFYTSPV